MRDMNASIFEEIDDQGLDGITAGSENAPNTIPTAYPSWCQAITPLAGNNGRFCTLTVECAC
jgi:hypothetical protein